MAGLIDLTQVFCYLEQSPVQKLILSITKIFVIDGVFGNRKSTKCILTF